MGALNIYSRGEGAFGRAEQELAAHFASHVTNILVESGAEALDDAAASRIQRALRSRKLIAQAQGILMERRQMGADDAAAILASTSRSEGRTVLAQATEVTESIIAADTGADHG